MKFIWKNTQCKKITNKRFSIYFMKNQSEISRSTLFPIYRIIMKNCELVAFTSSSNKRGKSLIYIQSLLKITYITKNTALQICETTTKNYNLFILQLVVPVTKERITPYPCTYNIPTYFTKNHSNPRKCSIVNQI